MRCGQTASEVTALLCLSLSLFSLSLALFSPSLMSTSLSLSLSLYLLFFFFLAESNRPATTINTNLLQAWMLNTWQRTTKTDRFIRNTAKLGAADSSFMNPRVPKLLRYYQINHLRRTLCKHRALVRHIYISILLWNDSSAFHAADRDAGRTLSAP